jgi:RNA polymerase sigma-70 factor (ECF subfamily)
MSAQPLEALLERLADGDEAAAEEFLRKYEPLLRQVVRRLLPPQLRSKLDTADVLQSVWADVVRGFKQGRWYFPDDARLRAFLVTMARNRFLDRVRQHSAALKHEERLAGPEQEAAVPAQQPHPSEEAQANELWERMVELCPPEHRELLRLKRQGLPMSELVARTGLHEDSIRRILRTLLRQLAFGSGGEGE